MSSVRSAMVKRILTIPLTMFIVSVIVFSAISFSAGDSSSYILSDDATAAERDRYREISGLDEPFYSRYLGFLSSFIRGDWGLTAGGTAIKEVIVSHIPVTLAVSILALVMSLVIALPVSYLTLKRGTVRSAAATAFSIVVSSMPVFLVSIFLVLIFSVRLGIFPVAGYVPPEYGFLLHIGSIFLPSLSLALLHSSLLIMMFRNSLRENMEKPFSRTYEALGMKRWKIALKGATKPSLPLLFILIGESAAAFLGGSAAVESVFALPGLGSLLVSAALSRDTHLAGILMMLVALFVSIASFLAEMVSALIDPRRNR